MNTRRRLFLALGRDDLEAAFRHHARDLNAHPAPEALRTVARHARRCAAALISLALYADAVSFDQPLAPGTQ